MQSIFTRTIFSGDSFQYASKSTKAPVGKVAQKLKIKRGLDVSLALLSLAILSIWLFPLIAFFIKIGSKGPIFFKQLRHGKNNRPFYCYKFRTMVINREADTLQAKRGDSRITKFGGILRRSSFDELPQLFNVLKGDMSLIGPRPHAVPMNEVFAKEIPGYMHRHAIKPGITGLAQSKGFRGEIEDFHDLNFRYRLDMFYIRRWSLLLDLKILLWTVHALFFKNGKAI